MAGGSTQDLREKVGKLEALLAVPAKESSSSTMVEQLAIAQKAIVDLQLSFDEHAAQTVQRLEERADEQADLAAHRMEGIDRVCIAPLLTTTPRHEEACLWLKGKVGFVPTLLV
ncbi:hypothetical protein FH972_005937 [Carpinus fangiana]|uniref:Uncharacterized protein n=1 Tax=Carpinus fangiana TaxID=176857 RepID=A0A5N6QQS6_9ROSI|nr:hypothetical protein FH972_005937 [Carpinus fangiana]